MAKFIVFLFFITVGWTGLDLIHEWVRLYILVGVIILLYLLTLMLSKKLPRYIINAFVLQDIFLVAFIFLGLVGVLLSQNEKSLSYVAAYFVVFTSSYMILKIFLIATNSLEFALTCNVIGVFIVFVYVAIEIYLKEMHGILMSEIIPKFTPDAALATFEGRQFYRVYGPMTEPSILGLYLNTLGVIGLWWASRILDRKLFVAYLLIFVVTYYFAHSAAAFASLLIASGFVIFYQKPALMLKFLILSLLFVILSVSIFALSDIVLESGNSSVIDKLFGTMDGTSDRFIIWQEGWQQIQEAGLFGRGLGFVATVMSASGGERGSYTNWYLSLLIESGFIGFLLFAAFFSMVISRARLLNRDLRLWMLLAILSGLIHFVAISTFFEPFLLVCIALMETAIISKRSSLNKAKH